MRAVILAAGDGGRLGRASLFPKPLVPLHGRPLIDYTLDSVAAAGIDDVVVVTGYRGDELVAALNETPHDVNVSFVTNPRYETGASLSLRAAREATGDEPFLLTMADHLLSRGLVERLLAQAALDPEATFVAADFGSRDPAYTDEATKLAITRDGRVAAIGKDLPAWSALDTGAFVFSPEAWNAVDDVPEDCELSDIFRTLSLRRGLLAADVTGEFWYDIDTPADLDAAASLVVPETLVLPEALAIADGIITTDTLPPDPLPV